MMDCALNNDELCIKNDKFCTKNDGFCISNGDFCISPPPERPAAAPGGSTGKRFFEIVNCWSFQRCDLH